MSEPNELQLAFTQLCDQIRKLLAAEYHRGERDAIARIVKAAQGAPAATNGSDVTETPAKKERAPAGTAKTLIERVLAERGQRGATPQEIKEAAQNSVEKLASFSGIRFALEKGREAQKYKNKHGKWFLVSSVS